jgi:hypothetical protein
MRASNLFPGARAIIMGAFKVKENIGKQVTLLAYVAPGEAAHFNDGETQGLFEGLNTGVWIVLGEDLSRYHHENGTTMISKVAGVAPQHLLSLGAEMLLVARKDHPAVHVTSQPA